MQVISKVNIQIDVIQLNKPLDLVHRMEDLYLNSYALGRFEI